VGIGEEKLASRLSAEEVKFNTLLLEATVVAPSWPRKAARRWQASLLAASSAGRRSLPIEDKDKRPPSDTVARVLIEHIKIENGGIECTAAAGLRYRFAATGAPHATDEERRLGTRRWPRHAQGVRDELVRRSLTAGGAASPGRPSRPPLLESNKMDLEVAQRAAADASTVDAP
jgi:hypothetical protein